MSPHQLIDRYMAGGCHALAFVLSQLLFKRVGILQAKRDGQLPIPDPLHVFVLLDDDSVLDVKGQRDRKAMEEDFVGLMALLKVSHEDQLTAHYESLDDADDLYNEWDFDPSAIKRAAKDLAGGLWDQLEFANKPAIDAQSIPRLFSKTDFGEDCAFGM